MKIFFRAFTLFCFMLLVFITSAAVYADKVLYVTDAGDTTILVTLTQPQIHALKHDLLDVGDWIRGSVQGKINSCRSRMIQEWMPRLQADPAVKEVPVNEDDLVEVIVKRDDYEDRATVEAAAAAAEKKRLDEYNARIAAEAAAEAKK